MFSTLSKISCIILFVSFTVFSNTLQAQDYNGFNKKIERLQKKHDISGLSIAIVKDGEIQYKKAYGHRSEAEKKIINEESLFQAGTLSQALVAIAILKEVQEGTYELNTDINEYLRNWKVRKSSITENNPVSIFHLLSHNAGINIKQFDAYHESENMASLIDILNGEGNALNKKILPIKYPGASFSFSSGGFAILQQLIVDTQKDSFESYMKASILDPLGMKKSRFDQPKGKLLKAFSNAAYGHDDEGVFFGKRPLYTTIAASGLWSTPADLAKIIIRIQDALQGENSFVLSPEATTVMLESISATQQENIAFSLGFYNYTRKKEAFFGYHGSAAGFSAMMIGHKSDAYGAVIMLNKQTENELTEDDIRLEIMTLISDYFDWEF